MAHRLNPLDPETDPQLYRVVENLSQRIDEAHASGDREVWLEGCHFLLEIKSDNVEGLAERCRAYRAGGDLRNAQVDFEVATMLVQAWLSTHHAAQPSLSVQAVEALVAERFPGYYALLDV